MRKGQGLSINMLIIIAIGLIVLIISIMTYVKHSRNAETQLSNTCAPAGGICQVDACDSGSEMGFAECPLELHCCTKPIEKPAVADP